MTDLFQFVITVNNGDKIEPDFPLIANCLHVGCCRTDNPVPLPDVHGGFRAAKMIVASGFDFNEDERVVGIPGNNVEFTVLPAPVSGCNFPSFTFKE